jgi:hypothetical protein
MGVFLDSNRVEVEFFRFTLRIRLNVDDALDTGGDDMPRTVVTRERG